MYNFSEEEELLCKKIVDCAYNVHNELGPGLLEKIYEVCFCHELRKKGISYCRQIYLPVYYDGLIFEEGLRIDVYVENRIICEIKAVEQVNPIWQSQLLSQLNLSGNHIGFLINFHVPRIKDGIRRYAL